MVRRFLALIIFFSFSHLAIAQNDCEASLKYAQDEFDAGRIERVQGILFECLSKFTKEQQVEAHRLLTITYLYLEDPLGAERSYLDLLNVDPEFRVSDTDPVELEYLSKQYITTPIISYSLKIGVNFSTTTVIQKNTIGNETDQNWAYKSGAGINLGGGVDLHFNKVVSLVFEAGVSYRTYTKTDILFLDTLSSRQDQTQMRKNWHADLPVSLRFTYPGEIYFPYVYGGYSPSITLSSKADDTRDPLKEAGHEDSGLDLSPQTPGFSHSLIFGAGLKRRVGKRFGYHYVMLDLRYRLGMTNMTKEETQFDFSNVDNKTHVLKQGQVDDFYRWNSFELTLAYVWPKYNPRPKNSVTIQTLTKKWFSKKEKADE